MYHTLASPSFPSVPQDLASGGEAPPKQRVSRPALVSHVMIITRYIALSNRKTGLRLMISYRPVFPYYKSVTGMSPASMMSFLPMMTAAVSAVTVVTVMIALYIRIVGQVAC